MLPHNALNSIVVYGRFLSGHLHGNLPRAPFTKVFPAGGANPVCEDGVIFLFLCTLRTSLFPCIVSAFMNACDGAKECNTVSIPKHFYEAVSDPGRYTNGAILGIPRVRAKKSFSASVYAHFVL